MKNVFFRKRQPMTAVQPEIDSVLARMQKIGPADPDYPKQLVYLERLESIKQKQEPDRIKSDTVLNGLFSLGGIVMIVAYEQKHVMRTIAVNWVPRLKNIF